MEKWSQENKINVEHSAETELLHNRRKSIKK